LKIEKELEGLKLIGESTKRGEIFFIEGRLIGEVEVECVKCLEKFNKKIDEKVKFKIVKPPYEGFDDEYDIIEQENFSIEELLKSEIEMIRSDYNICKNCEGEFNKEF